MKLCDALPKPAVRTLVQTWLAEDAPNFDYGGMVVGETKQTAHLFMKSKGVLAGGPFFNAVFEELGCNVTWLVSEGSTFTPEGKLNVAEVNGPCRQILLGERAALNCLARSSGIATNAQLYVNTVRNTGWKGFLAGTRKTTPGFRLVEKYALLVAGVDTHRYNLSSMAVKEVRLAAGFSVKIEVECQSLEEGKEAANAGADIVMFDNFTGKQIHEVSKLFKKEFPNVLVEASGGINEDNVKEYCSSHVDIISSSKLTQGYPVVDFSLKIL